MTITTARSEWKHPMIIDASVLNKLENLLIENLSAPKIKVSCSDDVDHEFTSMSSLEQYENTKRSKIESIRN